MIVLMLVKQCLVTDIFSHVVVGNRAQQPTLKGYKKAPMRGCVFIYFVVVQPKHFTYVPKVKREGRHKGDYV